MRWNKLHWHQQILPNNVSLGTMSEIFRSLRWKLCLLHAFEVYASSPLLWLNAFVKRITSDNKLMNLCEIGLFHIVWGVSKGTHDNYHEILENVLCPKYIDIYEFRGYREDVHGLPNIFCFIIKKTEKVQEHDWYLNQILHHFDLVFFSRMNNKKFTKRGPHSYLFMK